MNTKYRLELDIPDWMFEELRERRGYGSIRPSQEDMLSEIVDAIETRFGGSVIVSEIPDEPETYSDESDLMPDEVTERSRNF